MRVFVSSSTSLPAMTRASGQSAKITRYAQAIHERKNPPYSYAMRLEFKLNSMGGGDSRLALEAEGQNSPAASVLAVAPGAPGKDEICEELEPERGLDSASTSAGRLAEEALA